MCNDHTEFSLNRAKTAPDEKLAFVERVCGLLIESRFCAGYAAPWDLDICASGTRNSREHIRSAHCFCESIDEVIFDRVRFILPRAKDAVKLAKAYLATGIRRTSQSLLDRVPHGIVRDPKPFATRSLRARGSPCLTVY